MVASAETAELIRAQARSEAKLEAHRAESKALKRDAVRNHNDFQLDISSYIVHDVGEQARAWRAEERQQRALIKRNADALQSNVPWNSPRPRHLFVHLPHSK